MKDKTTLSYERRIAENAERAQKAAAEMKALYKEGQKLKRNARTHRLCNLGGMLEAHMKDPALFDEDEVEKFLDTVFNDDKVKHYLDKLIAKKQPPSEEKESAPEAKETDSSHEQK